MFVFVIFKKSTREIFSIYLEEDLCLRDFECLRYESSVYSWRAINIQHCLNRFLDIESEVF